MFRCLNSAALVVLLLAGCGGPLELLTGGGPNVAASVPITSGRTATNSVGVSTVTTSETTIEAPGAESVTNRQEANEVRADNVGSIHTTEVPAWLIIAFAVALFLDSPLRWPGQIISVFRGKGRT